MSFNSEKLLYNPYLSTQIMYDLSKSAKDEIENAKNFIKNNFLKNNQVLLEQNNYSVNVNAFFYDSEIEIGRLLFQVQVFDKEKNDVTISCLLNLK